jgi:hypothetical protein
VDRGVVYDTPPSSLMLMGKKKAPNKKSIDKLEAHLADMKKAAASQSKKHPWGRPNGRFVEASWRGVTE